MATADARAARERKQKIVVVVGGIVLLALLAFQLPRLLGGSSSDTAASETTAASEAAPAVPFAQNVALLDTDRPLAPVPGKLRSFTVFTKKDPFVQQVVSPTPTPGSGPESAGAGGKESVPKVPTKGFQVGETSAAVTLISVNGARQALQPGAAFPAADPVFVLVAENPGAKTVVVGIAGGAYASGAKTTKLEVGKPLVLVNTTTGARYRLVLVAVGTGTASTTANGATSSTQPSP